MQNSIIGSALQDIFCAIKQYSLIGMLGWQDVRHRYKRSSLGAFWLTISTGVMIATMGVIFSKIFHSSLREFLPFLALGMIFWGFISQCLTEGCQCFIIAQPIIKQLNIPLFVHVCRLIWKNIIIFAHNLVIFPIVLLVVWQPVTWVALLSIPGFVLMIINLTWVTLLLGILCARYRDMQPIINSILQILFYLTPIMWMPNRLSAHASLYLIDPNPMYHLLSIVRSPLLGEMPTATNWMVSITLALCGWCLTIIIYTRYRHRIAYWL
jgi:lipopolysaccharide transport system permease protein